MRRACLRCLANAPADQPEPHQHHRPGRWLRHRRRRRWRRLIRRRRRLVRRWRRLVRWRRRLIRRRRRLIRRWRRLIRRWRAPRRRRIARRCATGATARRNDHVTPTRRNDDRASARWNEHRDERLRRLDDRRRRCGNFDRKRFRRSQENLGKRRFGRRWLGRHPSLRERTRVLGLGELSRVPFAGRALAEHIRKALGFGNSRLQHVAGSEICERQGQRRSSCKA